MAAKAEAVPESVIPEIPGFQVAMGELRGVVAVATPAVLPEMLEVQHVQVVEVVEVQGRVEPPAAVPVGEQQFLQTPGMPGMLAHLKHILVRQHHRELLTLLQ